jgi:excisionase family DNA binding protein
MAGEADLVTVTEAAARTGYTVQHITRLIRQGKIAGKRYGWVWLTSLEAVERYKREAPKPGRRPGRKRG